MDVRSCRNCKRLFNYLGGPPICPACRDEQEKKFQDVKEYIREHPNCGMKEVSEAEEVDVKQIQQWVREERLQFSADSDVALTCERCGKKIFTGRYCDACKAGMANSLTKAFAGEPVQEEPKKKKSQGDAMRFLKR